MLDIPLFCLDKPFYGIAKIRIGDPMGRVGRAGQVATLNFMGPLGTGFNPGELVRNSIINGPIITGFKMQTINILTKKLI